MYKPKPVTPKNKESECIQTCVDLFGASYSTEIIETICQHTNYDVNATIERIFTMQSDIGDQTPQPTTTTTTTTGAISKQQQPQMTTPGNLSFSGALRNNKNPFDTANYTTQRRRPDPNNNSSDNFNKISAQIKENVKVLVLMRGLPGSGKSTLAKKLLDTTLGLDGVNQINHLLSADDYFMDRHGRYIYDRDRIGEAHEFTQNRVLKRMQEGWAPIIVDNTSLKVWEMVPYIRMAVNYQYVIWILEPTTPWARKPHILAKKNTHDVPEMKLRRMLDGYEPTTVRDMLRSLQLEQHLEVRPSLRQNPAPRYDNSACDGDVIMATAVPQPEKRGMFSFGDAAPMGWTESRDQIDVAIEEASKQCNLSDLPLPKPPRLLQTAAPPPQGGEKEPRPFQTVDWKPHEGETADFWAEHTPVDKAKEKTSSDTPLPRRQPLKEVPTAVESTTTAAPSGNEADIEAVSAQLVKHRQGCANENAKFVTLRTIYPTLPVIYLWDLFDKCNGDIEWTMDILLKDESTIDFLSDASQPPHSAAQYEMTCHCDRPKGGEEVSAEPPKVESPTVKATKREKPVVASTSEQQALRAIQQNFVIGDEHYSNAMKKVRDTKRGVNVKGKKVAVEPTTTVSEAPATAKVNESDPEELVEIELGRGLVMRLEALFGTELTEQNVDAMHLKTTVFMNKSMANQLHALWRESLYNQLEEQRIKSLKEDEEFARQLHAQEKYPLLHQPNEPNNLKDRMEMEAALESYRDEVKQSWQGALSNDMAAVMSRDKLFKLFPDVDRETLVEILAAHKGQFDETVQSLSSSLSGGKDVREVTDLSGRDLFEEARRESILIESAQATTNNVWTETPSNDKVLDVEEAKTAALKDFEECRNSAAYHSKLKSECYLKAKNAVSRGENGVALYYSQIANLHKSKIDQYNHKAANCIMEVHNLKQNNPDMLDLHYLHLAEAVQATDLFLDRHISGLKGSTYNSKNLFVITGRGLHSANGIPTVKLRVKQHLAARGLKFSEVNPGLLKVKIYANSMYAT